MKRALNIFTLSSLFACTLQPNSQVSTTLSSSPMANELRSATPETSKHVPPSNSVVNKLPSTPNSQASSANPSLSPAIPVSPLIVTSDLHALHLEVSNRFLSANGERAQLTVKDQNGNLIETERLRFVSTRSQDFSVDAAGHVEALTSEGFSTIIVSVVGALLSAEQLFSVSNPSSGSSGGSRNTPVPATQENVNGQIEFQF